MSDPAQRWSLEVLAVCRCGSRRGASSAIQACRTDQLWIHAAAIAFALTITFGPVFALLALWRRVFEKRPLWTLGFEPAGAPAKYARGFSWLASSKDAPRRVSTASIKRELD